jgi:hypothetical protein
MNPALRASIASLLTVVVSFMSIMTGCKSAEPTPPQSQSATPVQSTPASPPSRQMSVDDLVAPIALYPDQLLAQILTASTNAQEVLDGGNWLLQNQNLKGDALSNAAKQAGFNPSMQHLMSFPQVGVSTPSVANRTRRPSCTSLHSFLFADKPDKYPVKPS